MDAALVSGHGSDRVYCPSPGGWLKLLLTDEVMMRRWSAYHRRLSGAGFIIVLPCRQGCGDVRLCSGI